MEQEIRKIASRGIMTPDNDPYRLGKLASSLISAIDFKGELPIVIYDRDEESWNDIEKYEKNGWYLSWRTFYYACIEFPDGRHLPLPMLVGLHPNLRFIEGYDEDIRKYDRADRDGAQGELVDYAIRHIRPVRRAYIRAQRWLIAEIGFSLERD